MDVEVEYAPQAEPMWEFHLRVDTDTPSGAGATVLLDHGTDLGELPDCDDADTNQHEHC